MNKQLLPLFASLAIAALAQTTPPAPQVIATGLAFPQRMIATPGGNFIVSEAIGRVSLVTRGGARRSLIEGLPSGTTATGEASGPTALLLRGQTLYVAIGIGDLERQGPRPGTAVPNPQGVTSPLLASVLAFEFPAGGVDAQMTSVTLTAEQQLALSFGIDVVLQDAGGATVRASMLANIENAIPDANTIYRFSNPWGLEISQDGRTLYLVDASFNALIAIDTATGRQRRIATFPPIPNVMTGPNLPPVSDAVPTSARRYGNQLLVSFLTGFPFVPGQARVLIVDPETGRADPFIFFLNSVVDVAWRARPQQERPQFFVLEFSRDLRTQPPGAGRLLRYDTPNPTVAADNLTGPVSMVIDDAANAIFVLELTGRIVQVNLQ